MESPSHLNSSFILNDVEIGIMSFVNILFSIVGSLGNMFVCFAFVAYPNLRNASSVFVLSLACSDLLVCLVAQPMFVASLVKHYQPESVTNVFEDVRKRLTWISLLASAGNLLGVTIDRYVAIANPLRYGNRGTTPSARIFLALVWVVAIGAGISTGIIPKMKLAGQIYVFVVVIFLILPLYSRELYIATKHRRNILGTIAYGEYLTGDNRAIPTSQHRMHKKADRNALKTVGIICGVFFLGWFPLLILPFIYRSNFHNRKLVLDLFQWVNTLALCSSAVNPIVYSWTDRKFRKSLHMLYTRWAAKRLVSSSPTVRNNENRESSALFCGKSIAV